METDSRNTALLEHKASLYEQLVHIYPNDPRCLRRYAEILLQLGRTLQGNHAMERLQQLVQKSGDTVQAQALIELRREIDETTQSPHAASLFHFSNGKAMQTLLTHAKRRKIREGEYYIRQGSSGEDIAIILDGEMAVMTHFSSEKQAILIHVLGEGDIVGEMAFLSGSERCADVLANKDTVLMELSRKQMFKCLLEYPEVEEALHRETTIRKHIITLSRNPALAKLPHDLRRWLAEAAEIRRYPAFKVVWRAGQKPDVVGIVSSGLIRIVAEDAQGNSHILEPVKPGDLMGEITAVRDEPIMADMVAVTDTDILTIPLQIFRDVMHIHPPLREALLKQAAERITSTMALIRSHGASS
ncbi:MAG: hypothetical protein BMS9Abin18_0912 [Zetaproteobacteria bacterium]|nr:MAG: hypothetical protein BMS9Abin18_0912 [Zetaproteobacteria bacterium]